jgi:hypothetical protein
VTGLSRVVYTFTALQTSRKVFLIYMISFAKEPTYVHVCPGRHNRQGNAAVSPTGTTTALAATWSSSQAAAIPHEEDGQATEFPPFPASHWVLVMISP